MTTSQEQVEDPRCLQSSQPAASFEWSASSSGGKVRYFLGGRLLQLNARAEQNRQPRNKPICVANYVPQLRLR